MTQYEPDLMKYSTKLNHREVFDADTRTEVSWDEPKSAFRTVQTPTSGLPPLPELHQRRQSVFGNSWGAAMINQVGDSINLLNQQRKKKMNELQDYVSGPANDATMFDREEALAEVAKERLRMEKPKTLPRFKVEHKLTRPKNESVYEPQSIRGTLIVQNPENIPKYMEGYMHKKSDKWLGFAGWNRKWCKLDRKIFTFYKPKSKVSFTGSLNFDLMTIRIKKGDDDLTIELRPQDFSKTFIFRAESQVEFEQWYQVLENAIATSDGNKTNLTHLFQEAKFWKYERMGPKQLMKVVDSGDIMLFTSPAGMAEVQRVFSGSKYDHVGLFLVSNNPRQVFVLEATSNEGVGISLFTDFIKHKWYKLYQRLVLRRLIMPDKTEFYKKLQNFVDHAHGKAYSINASKLMKKVSVVGENEDFKDRTFFCSELVAAAYKRAGLLPRDKSSTQYWPGSFSIENDMQLEGGAELSAEYLIDFSTE